MADSLTAPGCALILLALSTLLWWWGGGGGFGLSFSVSRDSDATLQLYQQRRQHAVQQGQTLPGAAQTSDGRNHQKFKHQ